MGWKPVHILHGISLSIENVLKPAGLENAKDLITSNYVKEFGDPAWDGDPGMKKFVAFSTNTFRARTSTTRTSLTATCPRKPWCISFSNAVMT